MPAQLLGDDELTLAKVFKEAGYATGAIGKWGIGHPPPPDDPRKKGFDYFYGIPASLNFGVLAWFEGRYAEVPPTMCSPKTSGW